MAQLRDKVAVITGASRGLGRVIAERFAAEGARVVLGARSEEGLDRVVAAIRAAGGEASSARCDVAVHDQVEALAVHAEQTFGELDIWVNNAALSAPYGRVVEIEVERLRQAIEVNILGSYYGSVVALRRFVPRGRGKLINMLGRGDRRPVPMQISYAASKAWVRAFTLALAREHRKTDIGVFAFNPGLTDTDLLRRVQAVRGHEHRFTSLKTVMQLWMQPPEVPAERALWLASSATDGRTGLEERVLGFEKLLTGVASYLLRRVTGRLGSPPSIDVTVVPSALGDRGAAPPAGESRPT